MLKGLSLHALHRIEVALGGSTQMEDRGYVRVPHAGGGPRFAQETKPRRLITQVSFANNLQRHRASEIDVERFVSNPHRTATQLDRFAVFIRRQLVVLKAVSWLFRCRRLECTLGRRLAGHNPTSKTLAEHANRTEFHGSGKLVTATRASALGLRVHRTNRPSAATALSTEWCKIGVHGTWQSCCPVPQTIACSFIVARQTRFRNKIRTFGDLPPRRCRGHL